MKGTEISIRECDYSNPADREAVGMLINAYIADEMGGGELLTEARQRNLVDALGEHPKTILLLAKMCGEYCGMLIAFENFSTFTVRPMINIHDIITLKEYRGKGVGRQLLESVVGIAKRINASRITLEVREDNPVAQHLYRKIGFQAPEPVHYYWRKYL